MSSRSDDLRGSISAFVVCMVAALLLLGQFMFDSGRYVDTYLRASDVAEKASRIGAQSVVGIRSGNPHVDERLASGRARDFLRSEGLNGVVVASGMRVNVTVSVGWRPMFVGILGSRTIVLTRSANVVDE